MQKLIQELTELRATRCTGLVYSPNHALHAMDNHPESTLRVTEPLKHLEAVGLVQRCDLLTQFDPIDYKWIKQAHGDRYVDYLQNLWPKDSSESHLFRDDTYYDKDSVLSARYAAQGTIEATERVYSGGWINAFALLRPPGHHAGVDGYIEGFCLINNVVVAAEYLKSQHGAKRIAIIDWDVHHGDSTQKLTYNDPSILYISIHKYCDANFYPYRYSANADHLGEGPGLGYNLNFPLNPQPNEVG